MHRKLSVTVSSTRRRLDLEQWDPIEERGMPVTICSDKGEEVVRTYLSQRYANVHIRFIHDVPGQPTHKSYQYRVWN